MDLTNKEYHIDPDVVEAWIKGWAVTRGVPPSVRHNGGLRVDIGMPQHKTRYVFPYLNDGFKQLAETITEPWIFLKVCAPPEAVSKVLPPRWTTQPPGFMMTCFKPMTIAKTNLPEGYTVTISKDTVVPIIRIIAANGEVAANGRITFIDDFAIYDRVETHPDYRRRGLATILMSELESLAIAHNSSKGILVATAEGKMLYETLGWEMYSLYTTAVILGDDK